MNVFKIIAVIEVVVGLLILGYSNYLIISVTFFSQPDLHGYGLMLGLFGNSIGSVMAFAGTVYFTEFKYKALPQLLLIISLSVSIYV